MKINFPSVLQIVEKGISAHAFKEKMAIQNMANEKTLGRTKDEDPYRREIAIFNQKAGVINFKSIKDPSPFKQEYNPNHPYAKNGFIRIPNVNRTIENLDRNNAKIVQSTLFKIFGSLNSTAKRVYESMMSGG